MELQTRKESIILNENQLFSLHEKMNYSLTTAEETMFLLTIVKASPCPTYRSGGLTSQGGEPELVNGRMRQEFE